MMTTVCLQGSAQLRHNNSTIKHDTTELITPYHSESTAHSDVIIIIINISYYGEILKINEKPLIIDLEFLSNLSFLQCAENSKQFTLADSPPLAVQTNLL